jgi:Transposase zinc-binding domain/Putative transposase
MSAIVSCRTAALGGHVTRCEDCAHTQIAYNSCRNRHCPKCQGAAARDWLAEREADLLPVPYFHLVFTLPAAIAAIAYQNKAVIYDALFKASSETLLTIAADPKYLGARIGVTAVLHTWGSAMTPHPHVHTRRWALGRWIQVGRVQAGLLCAGARALEALPQADAGEARHGAGHRQAAVLRRARSSRSDAFAAFLAPLKTMRWFVYSAKGPAAAREH